MKTFKKSSLPPYVAYNGKVFMMHPELSAMANSTNKATISKKLTENKNPHVFVEVHNKALKGKLDIHNKPYPPSLYVFTEA